MTSLSDHELLERYAAPTPDAERAFAILVERHLNLVYSVARRHVRSPQLAEEVAQSVFLDLARQARRIDRHAPLAAWLHLVSRRTAVDLVRRETRRRGREQAAAALADMKTDPAPWQAIAPLLDEAVENLPPADRTAILLRFFENKSLREVGAALGTNDDAAQKRVGRALDQLRAFFQRRGVTVTTATLASDLSAHVIEAAPAGLGRAISHAATLGGVAAVGTAIETSRLIALTAGQKSVALAALVSVAGAGLYQAHLAAQQTSALNDVRYQTERATGEIRDLRLARAATAARLADVEKRIDARLAQPPPLSSADAALSEQMRAWFGQVDRLKDFLSQRPEWEIPELKLLTAQDWFNAVGAGPLESEEQLRRASGKLRDLAVSLGARRISQALNTYVRLHDGQLPSSPLELATHFDPPIPSAILERYEMLRTGRVSDIPQNLRTRLLAPKAPADVEYDTETYVGTNGYGNRGAAMYSNVGEAQRRFNQAHPGQNAPTAEQLLPYLKWPVSAPALQKFLEAQSAPRQP